jgi:hypothetical protein
MNLKYLAAKEDDESFGSTFYVVDSDRRTVAQGWSQADGTGPLDLWTQRNHGRVFYTSGGPIGSAYATDAAAFQGAIDAAVDFRGDKVYLTPGAYSLATAVSIDCPAIRILGPKRGHAKQSVVSVTTAIDKAYTIAAAGDDVEIAYQTLIPLTAKTTFSGTAAGDRGHLHHLFWDATGIATSTGTEFFNGAASQDWLVENCQFYVDAPQGDAFTLASSLRWVWQDCDFVVGLTAVAWASVFTFTTSALGNIARRCYFRGAGGATAAVFTNIFTGIANVNGQLLVSDCRVDGTALSTPGDIETTFGTTTDIELIENYLSGDATTEPGAVIKLT